MYKIYGDDVKFVNMKNKWQTLKNVPDLIKTLTKLPDDNTRYNAILNYLEPEKADIKLTKMKLVKPSKSKDIKLYELQQRKKQLEEEKKQKEETINEFVKRLDELSRKLTILKNTKSTCEDEKGNVGDNVYIAQQYIKGQNLLPDEIDDKIDDENDDEQKKNILINYVNEAIHLIEEQIKTKEDIKDKDKKRTEQIDKELNVVVNQINTLSTQTIENIQTETIGNLQVNSIKELNLNLKELLTKNLNDLNKTEASVINDLKNKYPELSDKLDTEEQLLDALNLLNPENLEGIKKDLQEINDKYYKLKEDIDKQLERIDVQDKNMFKTVEDKVDKLTDLFIQSVNNLTPKQKEIITESGVDIPKDGNQSVLSQLKEDDVKKIVKEQMDPLKTEVDNLKSQITGFNDSINQINEFIKKRISYDEMLKLIEQKRIIEPINEELTTIFKPLFSNFTLPLVYRDLNTFLNNAKNNVTYIVEFFMSYYDGVYNHRTKLISFVKNGFDKTDLCYIIGLNRNFKIYNDLSALVVASLINNENFAQYFYDGGIKQIRIKYVHLHEDVYMIAINIKINSTYQQFFLNDLILINNFIQIFPDYFGLQQAAAQGFKDKDKDKVRKPNKFIEMYDMIKVMYDKLILNEDNDELVERLKNITYSKFK